MLDFGLIIEIVFRFEYRGRGQITDRISGLISKLESAPKSEVDVGFRKSNMRVRSLFELPGLEWELVKILSHALGPDSRSIIRVLTRFGCRGWVGPCLNDRVRSRGQVAD